MLDIGWSELAVVAVIALIVVGPKDLPRVLRSVGGWARKARSMAREFQGTLEDMARESELSDIGKEVRSVADYDVSKEFENAIDPTGIDSLLDEPVDHGGSDSEDRPEPAEADTPKPPGEAASSDAPADDATPPAKPAQPAKKGESSEEAPDAAVKTQAAG